MDNAIASAKLFLEFAEVMKEYFQNNPKAGNTNNIFYGEQRGLIKHQARILSHFLAKLRK
ncbi:MAG: hypothetical protein ACK5X3_12690 [Pseudomonadota bacterium]